MVRALAECAAQGAGCGAVGRIRDYAWVAPTYGVAERGVEAFRTIAPDFVRIVGRMPARAEFDGAAGDVACGQYSVALVTAAFTAMGYTISRGLAKKG
jgi:hypothetical protein